MLEKAKAVRQTRAWLALDMHPQHSVIIEVFNRCGHLKVRQRACQMMHPAFVIGHAPQKSQDQLPIFRTIR
ncbi:MAG TPA: hypothetical protein DIT13_06630, partial [Verrucomicrobiales bacterium]|nr:hypothetical protein [Verrucomicrobiales bacterium]